MYQGGVSQETVWYRNRMLNQQAGIQQRSLAQTPADTQNDKQCPHDCIVWMMMYKDATTNSISTLKKINIKIILFLNLTLNNSHFSQLIKSSQP